MIALLDHVHAPVVSASLLAIFAHQACFLHKSKRIPLKQRRSSEWLALVIFIVYICESLYYWVRVSGDTKDAVAEHLVMHCLESILLWMHICWSLFSHEELLWKSYSVSFCLNSLFTLALCALRTVEMRQDNISLVFSYVQAGVSLALAVIAAYIMVTYREVEDEKLQPPPRSSSIENRQSKRLTEQGWLGYIKSFVVIIPYIWPKDDPTITLCFVCRMVCLIVRRLVNVMTPGTIGSITDRLIQDTRSMPLDCIALWIISNYAQSLCSTVDTITQGMMEDAASKRLDVVMYGRTMDQSKDFHATHSLHQITGPFTQGRKLIALIDSIFFGLIPDVLDLVLANLYLLTGSDAYTILILLFMGTVYIRGSIHVIAQTNALRHAKNEANGARQGRFYDTVPKWETVAYSNRIPSEKRKYKEDTEKEISATLAYSWNSQCGLLLRTTFLKFGYYSCGVLILYKIVYYGQPLGAFASFLAYWPTLNGSFGTFMSYYERVSNVSVDIKAVFEVLVAEPSIKDPDCPEPLPRDSMKVEFENVEFAYDLRQPVIKNFTLTVEPGETIALVGESGGGKSTVVDLVRRMMDPTNGVVRIGGKDIRHVRKSALYRAVGFVQQNTVLLNQTIKENVRYVSPKASDEDVEEACKLAAIHNTIAKFPDGYNTHVGESGQTLSGGQRQRLAIARSFLQKPRILVFDEATSAIDSINEAKIQNAIQSHRKGLTTFMIAHRLSTIVKADQICVLDKGTIVEIGTHDDLLRRKGQYYQLWMRQTAGNGGDMDALAID